MYTVEIKSRLTFRSKLTSEGAWLLISPVQCEDNLDHIGPRLPRHFELSSRRPLFCNLPHLAAFSRRVLVSALSVLALPESNNITIVTNDSYWNEITVPFLSKLSPTLDSPHPDLVSGPSNLISNRVRLDLWPGLMHWKIQNHRTEEKKASRLGTLIGKGRIAIQEVFDA